MPIEVQLVVAGVLLAVAELQLVMIMVYLVVTDFHLVVMIDHNINILATINCS